VEKVAENHRLSFSLPMQSWQNVTGEKFLWNSGPKIGWERKLTNWLQMVESNRIHTYTQTIPPAGPTQGLIMGI